MAGMEQPSDRRRKGRRQRRRADQKTTTRYQPAGTTVERHYRRATNQSLASTEYGFILRGHLYAGYLGKAARPRRLTFSLKKYKTSWKLDWPDPLPPWRCAILAKLAGENADGRLFHTCSLANRRNQTGAAAGLMRKPSRWTVVTPHWACAPARRGQRPGKASTLAGNGGSQAHFSTFPGRAIHWPWAGVRAETGLAGQGFEDHVPCQRNERLAGRHAGWFCRLQDQEHAGNPRAEPQANSREWGLTQFRQWRDEPAVARQRQASKRADLVGRFTRRPHCADPRYLQPLHAWRRSMPQHRRRTTAACAFQIALGHRSVRLTSRHSPHHPGRAARDDSSDRGIANSTALGRSPWARWARR